ncbi:hypothetical protein VTH06DRAFT_2028 [Thermothelomyces fergusii]
MESHHVPGQRIPADGALTRFRLALGITAAPQLAFSRPMLRRADSSGLCAL